MKRICIGPLALLALAGGLVGYGRFGSRSDWKEGYKRFLYSEMLKNSPILFTPETIEGVIGEPPFACKRPSNTFTAEESAQFQREGVGPNQFSDEIRDAFRRTDAFSDN